MADVPGEKPPHMLDQREIVELIIKAKGIHEGKWVLAAEFGIATGRFGPSPDHLVPGVAVGLSKLGVQQVTDAESAPAPIIVDASAVNSRQVNKSKRAAKASKKKG